MPISAGEVQAILSARDTMSPAMQLAAARVAELEYKLGTLGTSSVAAFNVMNAQFAVAQERLEKLVEGNNSFTSSMGQVDSMATRLITRLAILYAAHETFNFIVDMFTAADAMVKLSDSTGLTLGKLQELQYAADQLGVPFTKVSSSVEAFQKTLAQNKLTTEDALESIGLSFSKIFAMNPDERITAVLVAIGKIPDVVVRARAELELFGTEGVDPLARRFAALGTAAKDSNAVLSDETVHALANTVTLYRGFWADIKPVLENIIDGGQRATAALAGIFMNPNTGSNNNSQLPVVPVGNQTPIDTSSKLPNGIKVTGNPFDTAPISDYIDKLKAAAAGEKALTDEQIKQLLELDQLNLLTEKNAALLTKDGKNLDINTAQYKEFLQLLKEKKTGEKEATAATEEYFKAVNSLNNAGEGWQKTLDEIDGSVVESVKSMMDAGVSAKALGLAYELNAEQIKAIAKSRQDDTTQAKLQASATLEIIKLTDQLNQIVGDDGASAYQKQVNAIEKWSSDLVAKMSKAGTDTNEFYDTLATVVLAKYKKISADWKSISELSTTDTKQGLQEIADVAQKTYDEAYKKIGTFSEESVLKLKDAAVAAQIAADSWGTSVVNNANKAAAAVNIVTQGFYAEVDAINAANNAASSGLQTSVGTRAPHLENGIWVDGNGKPMSTSSTGFKLPGFSLPGFAKGGIVTVGEEGPERVALPEGATVFPNGSQMAGGGGDVSVTVNMNVNGLLDPATIRTVSTEVSKEIIKRAKQSLPYGSR